MNQGKAVTAREVEQELTGTLYQIQILTGVTRVHICLFDKQEWQSNKMI